MDPQKPNNPSGNLGEWCKKNQLLCALIVVLVIWVVWRFVLRRERMQPFFLDQIAMQASNPSIVNFLGNERDPLGMSLYDYYTENTMNANNTVAPQFNNDMAFANHTDYLQMPRWYRPPPGYKPRPLAALLAGDNVSIVTPSIDSVNTSSVDGGSGGSGITSNRALERMNHKNKSGRERFLH